MFCNIDVLYFMEAVMFLDKKIFVFHRPGNHDIELDTKNILSKYAIDYDFITISSQSVILGGILFQTSDEKQQFVDEFNALLGNNDY